MSTYLGLDVLDQTVHDRAGSVEESLRRKLALLDGGTGAREADAQSGAPAPARPFLWTCLSRAAVAGLRAFLDARKGRCVPFWVPTYQQDLTLAADLGSGASSATIRWVGYALHLFPPGGARRHLALYEPGAALVYRRVTAATDPGTGLTESLALDSPAPRLFPAATTVVSFLRLCRLDDDDVRIEWSGRGFAQAELRIRDLPAEAPV